MKNTKNTKDKQFMNLAKEIASWSKDPSTKVGAVIVGHKGQIVSQGYNGFPRGFNDSEERLNNRELKYPLVIHAEKNAIYNAIYNGSSPENCSIYVYGMGICHECAKGIIQVGIKKVYMSMHPSEGHPPWNESGLLALEMFDEAGVEYEIVM